MSKSDLLIERVKNIYSSYENSDFTAVYVVVEGKEYEVDVILYNNPGIDENWVDEYEIESVWNAFGTLVDVTPIIATAVQEQIDEMQKNYDPDNLGADVDLDL